MKKKIVSKVFALLLAACTVLSAVSFRINQG